MRFENIPTEDEEQAALFRWVAFASATCPQLKLLIHIPNEGKRSQSQGAKLKRMGLRPGVPDLILPVANGEYNCLFIELKRVQGGKLSQAQKWWLDTLNGFGCRAVRCNGWYEAKEEICAYLGIRDKLI